MVGFTKSIIVIFYIWQAQTHCHCLYFFYKDDGSKMTFTAFIREVVTLNLNQKGRNKTQPVKCAVMYVSSLLGCQSDLISYEGVFCDS